MPIWTIYCHIHIESGRRYIGLTSQTMAQRWKTHVSHAKSSKGGRWHFPNAIRKYGKDAFSHEELACSWTLEDANATEEALILQYDTRNPGKGFNLAKGGASFSFDPKTTREKLSEATKKNITPERRKFLSDLRRGKSLSQETRAKLSAAAKKNGAQIAASNRKRGPEYWAKFAAAGHAAQTPEVYERIATALRGKSISSERRIALLDAAKNMSSEARLKVSNAFRGKTHTPEVRAKLSESVKRQARNDSGQYTKRMVGD